MNKDQVKGQAKKMAGTVQQAAGKLVDSKSQQAKGASLKVEGQIQKGVGNVKEATKDMRDAATHAAHTVSDTTKNGA